MNPKTLKTVNKHLQKEDLSTHKIDLNLIKQAKQILDEGNRELAYIKKNGDKANELLENVQRVGDDFLRSNFTEAGDIIDALEKGAKTFGIPVPKEVKELEKMMDTGLRYRKAYSF